MGLVPQFIVSSKRLEERRIDPAALGLTSVEQVRRVFDDNLRIMFHISP